MKRPSLENFTSEMEEMISEKKDFCDGSSSSSNSSRRQHWSAEGSLRLACWSHNAESRISASLMVPFELEYMNRLQCIGWNSAAVMTSVSSSMLTGLMSTMSVT